MSRGGARPGAGRPPRVVGVSTRSRGIRWTPEEEELVALLGAAWGIDDFADVVREAVRRANLER